MIAFDPIAIQKWLDTNPSLQEITDVMNKLESQMIKVHASMMAVLTHLEEITPDA